MKQLTLFEENILTTLKPIKHWAYNTEVVEHIDKRYGIDRRGNVYDHKKKRFLSTASREHENGYIMVNLPPTLCNRKYKQYLVHRLVACTFLENNNKLLYNQVDHIDEDKTNHHVLNLRWVTASENKKKKENKKQLEMF